MDTITIHTTCLSDELREQLEQAGVEIDPDATSNVRCFLRVTGRRQAAMTARVLVAANVQFTVLPS
jgi:outer membrane lipopolysaccharide assembly protein LptE/RlpB